MDTRKRSYCQLSEHDDGGDTVIDATMLLQRSAGAQGGVSKILCQVTINEKKDKK
jgi:hypothetical protein